MRILFATKHQVTKKAQKLFFCTSVLVSADWRIGVLVIWWHFLFWIYKKTVKNG